MYNNTVQKKRPKCFLVISPIKIGRFWWNLVDRFLNKLLQNDVNVCHSHVHEVSTLPCETWNAHYACACYRWVVTVRNSRLCPPPLNCGIRIRQIWMQLITACRKYCRRRCTKHASLISYKWRHWQIAAMTTWSNLPIPFLVAVSVRSDQWCIFSCNAPTRRNELDSNLANFGVTVKVK